MAYNRMVFYQMAIILCFLNSQGFYTLEQWDFARVNPQLYPAMALASHTSPSIGPLFSNLRFIAAFLDGEKDNGAT